MKTVLLHGLGQTAQDWKEVVQQLSISDVDCPELFSSAEDEISYSQILGDLEQRYSEVKEPLRICGLSLGALLAIDFAIRHEEKVASLVLIGAQYKVPSLLIDFQNLIFRCMPDKALKYGTIKKQHHKIGSLYAVIGFYFSIKQYSLSSDNFVWQKGCCQSKGF